MRPLLIDSLDIVKIRQRTPVILKHAGTPGHDAGTADAGAGDDYVLITGHRDTARNTIFLSLSKFYRSVFKLWMHHMGKLRKIPTLNSKSTQLHALQRTIAHRVPASSNER